MPELTAVHLELIKQGKVRDLYRFYPDPQFLVMITTDRVSAFDRVLPTEIPGKGEVVNLLSAAWFRWVIENQIAGLNLWHTHFAESHFPSGESRYTRLELREVLFCLPGQYQRSWMIVREIKDRFPIEWIVRRRLVGSAWRSYQETRKVGDHKLPRGLSFGDALTEPIVTFTTKSETGHDRPLSLREVEQQIGSWEAFLISIKSLELFKRAEYLCSKARIVLVDTKLEWGKDRYKELILIDEIFTPDSSRFLLREDLRRGEIEFYNKEYLRKWLREEARWSGEGEAPELPPRLVKEIQRRYQEVALRLLPELARSSSN